jgi:hypothetical protein
MNLDNIGDLSEDTLKRILKAWLEAQAWQVGAVAWGKSHGADIEATKDGRHWIIEVKGLGSRNPMRVNYFLSILGETLQRMSDPMAKYSIALPDVPQFVGLWERLPELAKFRTGITALLVDRQGNVRELS